ncbi:MAG: alpha/beta fold hydrolase [Pseudomonadota bacterium]
MKSMIRFFIIVALLLPLSAYADEPSESAEQAPVTVEFIPAEAFAAPQHIVGPQLSPDGNSMVYRERLKDKSYLTIHNFETAKLGRLSVPEKSHIKWYRWAGNDRILMSIRQIEMWKGDELAATVLYYYQVSTGKFHEIGGRLRVFDNDNVLYVARDGSYMIQSIRESFFDYPGVYRVDISTGEATEIVKPQKKIWKWVTDNQGVVRMGISYGPRRAKYYYRSSEGEKFEFAGKVKTNAEEDEREEAITDIVHVVSGKDEGYVLSNKETGRFALYRFNYLTKETGEMVMGHPENDITGYSLNDDGTALEAIYYTDMRDRVKWFDPTMQKHYRGLEKALPGREVWVVSRSRNNARMIIFTTSAQEPGSYYLYEPAKRAMQRLGGINDAIDPAQMADTRYVSYEARDGLRIFGYLTLPKGREPEDLPLIILPHGGPFGVRDTLDFHPEVQFLANRGYAVFQPNYRGSESYGEDFYKSGEGEIGRAMQDDLDDAMDWLVAEGIADPDRVCLVGGSYGGYAALFGVIRNPERYRCAASWAGVTDWGKILKYDKKFFKRSRHFRQWREKIRGEDGFDLDDVAPARLADRLTRPVLLAQGKQDTIVPYSQYERMLDAAKQAGSDRLIETMVSEESGHSFDGPETEAEWYRRLEAFLTKHNPAYVEQESYSSAK